MQAFEQVLVASEHVVPFVHSVMVIAQLPAEHSPVETPAAVQVTLQLRLLAPSGAFVHVPGVALHVLQSPEQASSQQKPSTQNPRAHWLGWLQTAPTSNLHVLSEAHAYPVGQGDVGEHEFEQTPAEQWVPFEHSVLLFNLHWPVPSHDRSSAVPFAQPGVHVPLVVPAATVVHVPRDPSKAHERQMPSPQDAALQQ